MEDEITEQQQRIRSQIAEQQVLLQQLVAQTAQVKPGDESEELLAQQQQVRHQIAELQALLKELVALASPV